MSMIEVRVNVPIEREIEFYRWFADWRDGAGEAVAPVEAPAEATLDAAVAWWKSLTPKESGIWSMWIDAAPAMVTAEAIVRALGLKGPRDIPGALAWSGRKGKRVGFRVDWLFRNDPATGDPIYGIEDVEYARLLGRARDLASQTSTGARSES